MAPTKSQVALFAEDVSVPASPCGSIPESLFDSPEELEDEVGVTGWIGPFEVGPSDHSSSDYSPPGSPAEKPVGTTGEPIGKGQGSGGATASICASDHVVG